MRPAGHDFADAYSGGVWRDLRFPRSRITTARGQNPGRVGKTRKSHRSLQLPAAGPSSAPERIRTSDLRSVGRTFCARNRLSSVYVDNTFAALAKGSGPAAMIP